MPARTSLLGSPTWTHRLEDYVACLRWSPDGTGIVVGDLSGTTRILDATSGLVVAELPTHTMGTLAVEWSPSGELLATGGQDGTVRVLDRSGAIQGDHQLGDWVTALQWRPSGDLLAAGAGRRLWFLDRAGRPQLSSEPVESTITDVVWSADGRRAGVACYGGVPWFEPEHGAKPVKHFRWKGSLLSLAVSPDGRWLTGGAQDQSVHVWRLWSADDLQMSGYPTKVEHLSWHHTSQFLAVGNLGEVTIWDFGGRGPQGTRPVQLDGHERHITALAYGNRSDLLASGGADGRMNLWRCTSRETSPLEVLSEPGTEISQVAWAPDDDRLAVATADGQVRLHSLAP